MKPKPFITLDRVTLRVGSRWLLPHTSWQICTGQQWAILGPNGAGKSTLAGALTGNIPHIRGRVVRHDPAAQPHRLGYVSFELHRRLVAREDSRDSARHFSGKLDEYRTPRDLILERMPEDRCPQAMLAKVATRTGISNLLDQDFRRLSSGEMRKVLIARALITSPELLVLDEPFGGLDRKSRQRLADTLQNLIRTGVQLVLVTNRLEEIFPGINHILCLNGGRVAAQGPRGEMMGSEVMKTLYPTRRSETPAVSGKKSNAGVCPILVKMEDVTVSYGEKTIFGGLNWIMRRGEHWAVSGPNGSGKSTLVQLVTGDHLQAYSNRIQLFGRTKGSGESIWDIKARIGLVSSELQIRYRKPISALEAVVSGFFDSIGLYRHARADQRQAARTWMSRLRLEHLAERNITRLSFGELRMVLLARALVKFPLLLILDEPCQGLDPANRHQLLTLVDRIADETTTHVLYVTHHPQELPSCITHQLDLRDFAPPDRIMEQ